MTDRLCNNKKLEFSHVNIDKEYSNINLIDYKKKLFRKECELKKELKNIYSLKKKTNFLIAKKCKEVNLRHDWIREREDCMYGTTFTYCKMCRTDYYDRSYFYK
mgnify:CR=1 FL=1|tara:strand:- start:2198 stop:2509 length:312 start_codon:yes stop_codon:yes gene_type:complete